MRFVTTGLVSSEHYVACSEGFCYNATYTEGKTRHFLEQKSENSKFQTSKRSALSTLRMLLFQKMLDMAVVWETFCNQFTTGKLSKACLYYGIKVFKIVAYKVFDNNWQPQIKTGTSCFFKT